MSVYEHPTDDRPTFVRRKKEVVEEPNYAAVLIDVANGTGQRDDKFERAFFTIAKRAYDRVRDLGLRDYSVAAALGELFGEVGSLPGQVQAWHVSHPVGKDAARRKAMAYLGELNIRWKAQKAGGAVASL